MTTYAVILEQDEDGGYAAWIPDLPRCASQGDSYADALSNIEQAARLHIENLRASGLPIPEPRTRVAELEPEREARQREALDRLLAKLGEGQPPITAEDIEAVRREWEG